MSRASRILTIIGAILLHACVLPAQTAETPLSPLDRGYRQLPQATIQAADSANGNVAVVWGTTEIAADNSLALRLYVQCVKNGLAIGSPVRVGTNALRPSGEFCVAPIGNAFLVLYGARYATGSAQIYAQVFQPATLRLTSPIQLVYPEADAPLFSKRAIGCGNEPYGWRVFWRGANNNFVYSAVIDSHGVAWATGPTSGYRARLLSYSAHPDLYLLHDPDGASRIIYRATGTIDSRPLPRLSGPFNFGDDGSLVTLTDSTLRLYRTPFDTAPEVRSLPLHSFDLSASQVVVSRNRSGGIVLLFCGGRAGDVNAYRKAANAVTRLSLDSITASIRVDTSFTDSIEGPESRYYFPHAYSNSTGCDNHQLVTISWENWAGRAGTTSYMLFDGSDMSVVAAPVDLAYLDTPTIRPLRVPAAPAPVFVSGPVARKSPVHHVSPTVTAFPTGIVASWRELDTATLDVQTEWSIPDGIASNRSLFVMDELHLRMPAYSKPATPTTTSNSRSVGLAGQGFLESNVGQYAYFDGWTGSRPPVEYKGRVAASLFELARVGPTRWETVGTLTVNNPWDTPPISTQTVFGEIAAYNPEDHGILVLLRIADFDRFTGYAIRGYRTNGTHWDAPAPAGLGSKPRFISMGGTHYIVIDSIARYVDSAKVRNSFALPDARNLTVRYFKLTGPNFAQTLFEDDAHQRFRVRVFDTTGAEIRSTVFAPTDTTNDYTLIQSAADSTIAILFGGNSGVHVTLLRPNLDVLNAVLLLGSGTARAQHPAGAFRNDTLFAVWEDFRGATSRIYGAILRVPRLSAVNTTRGATPASGALDEAVQLFPNPAGSEITVSFDRTIATNLTFELFDLLGVTVVPRMQLGEGTEGSERVLSLEHLPAGLYLARITTSTAMVTRRVVKQ